MSWKSLVSVALSCVLVASPVLAAPTLTITGGIKNQAGAPVRVWNVAAVPDYTLSASSSLALEMGFQALGGNILSITALPNMTAAAAPVAARVDFDVNTGNKIFGWETTQDVGGGIFKPTGIQIGTGADQDQAVAFIGASLFTTAGAKDLFTITTDATVTSLDFGGAFSAAGAYLTPNGTLQGRAVIAQNADSAPGGSANYFEASYAGTLTPNLTPGGAGTWFLGDMNGNGSVTSLDTSRYNLALFQPDVFKAQNPNLNILRADMNGSGTVTSLDTARYNNILFATNGQPQGSGSGLGSGAAVPEPASALLAGLVLACVSMIRRRGR